MPMWRKLFQAKNIKNEKDNATTRYASGKSYNVPTFSIYKLSLVPYLSPLPSHLRYVPHCN